MIGLLAFNAITTTFFPGSIYVLYFIIIFAVLNSKERIFWGNKLTYGLFSGAVLIGTVFGIEVLAGWIKVEGFDFDPYLLFSFFILQVLVAAGEEIAFRGYILKNLIYEAGFKKGLVLTSFMFSAIHAPSMVYYGLDTSRGTIALAVVGMLGTIVAIIYLKYGLISAIGFHFSWNFLQYNIFTLTTQPGLFKSRYLGENLLTGGSYGPEAGIIGFLIVLLALAVLLSRFSPKIKAIYHNTHSKPE